jgi:hypothetical protein
MGMRQPARLSATLAYGLPEDILASADSSNSDSRGIGSVLALLVLVVGLAAATVWFVALPALDRTPVERTCEVVILKSGAPDCVSDVPRASQKAPQKASRAAKR